MNAQINAQMPLHVVNIEFKRYSFENREHREAFINCLQTFQQHLPLAETPELVEEWDYRNVSITLRHFGEKFRLQEEARRPLPTVAVGG